MVCESNKQLDNRLNQRDISSSCVLYGLCGMCQQNASDFFNG